jgi:hypothetical protein
MDNIEREKSKYFLYLLEKHRAAYAAQASVAAPIRRRYLAEIDTQIHEVKRRIRLLTH